MDEQHSSPICLGCSHTKDKEKEGKKHWISPVNKHMLLDTQLGVPGDIWFGPQNKLSKAIKLLSCKMLLWENLFHEKGKIELDWNTHKMTIDIALKYLTIISEKSN